MGRPCPHAESMAAEAAGDAATMTLLLLLTALEKRWDIPNCGSISDRYSKVLADLRLADDASKNLSRNSDGVR